MRVDRSTEVVSIFNDNVTGRMRRRGVTVCGCVGAVRIYVSLLT